MHRLLVSLAVVLSGCEVKHTALENQFTGVTTGFFSLIEAHSMTCGMLAIGGDSMDLTFIHPDTSKDILQIPLTPLRAADQHFQFATGLRYGFGDSARAAIDIERGHELVDPELEGDVAKQAKELRTSMYFPLYVHKLVVEPRQLCNADPVTNERIDTDCLDIPASSIEEARLWCSIGADVNPEFTR